MRMIPSAMSAKAGAAVATVFAISKVAYDHLSTARSTSVWSEGLFRAVQAQIDAAVNCDVVIERVAWSSVPTALWEQVKLEVDNLSLLAAYTSRQQPTTTGTRPTLIIRVIVMALSDSADLLSVLEGSVNNGTSQRVWRWGGCGLSFES